MKQEIPAGHSIVTNGFVGPNHVMFNHSENVWKPAPAVFYGDKIEIGYPTVLVKNSKVELFLDLEGTIIRSWHDPEIINLEKIKGYIREFGVTKVCIFSYAIRNETDQATFEKQYRGFLEEKLGVTITQVPTVEHIKQPCLKFYPKAVPMYDFEFVNVWTKQRAFIDNCTHRYITDNAVCVLLDDVVQNMTMVIEDKNLTIRTIKI